MEPVLPTQGGAPVGERNVGAEKCPMNLGLMNGGEIYMVYRDYKSTIITRKVPP